MSDTIRHLGRTEVPGGGQIAMQGHYAFIGHLYGPDGTTILDVSDHGSPRSSPNS